MSGEEPFNEWFKRLKDVTIKARILRRLDRLEFSNYGDHRYLTGGLFELKFDIGPGYRVYCGEEENQLVVLLCAGDKSSQSKDILERLS